MIRRLSPVYGVGPKAGVGVNFPEGREEVADVVGGREDDRVVVLGALELQEPGLRLEGGKVLELEGGLVVLVEDLLETVAPEALDSDPAWVR